VDQLVTEPKLNEHLPGPRPLDRATARDERQGEIELLAQAQAADEIVLRDRDRLAATLDLDRGSVGEVVNRRVGERLDRGVREQDGGGEMAEPVEQAGRLRDSDEGVRKRLNVGECPDARRFAAIALALRPRNANSAPISSSGPERSQNNPAAMNPPIPEISCRMAEARGLPLASAPPTMPATASANAAKPCAVTWPPSSASNAAAVPPTTITSRPASRPRTSRSAA
jgi:hypothetical protein